MHVGNPASTRATVRKGDYACVYQYDESEDNEPCMVFVRLGAVMNGRPIHVIHLRDLWKYADDEFLWGAAREMTANLNGGQYSRFEHRNLFFFINDCLSNLLTAKPFPEALIERPELEIAQVGDARFQVTAH